VIKMFNTISCNLLVKRVCVAVIDIAKLSH